MAELAGELEIRLFAEVARLRVDMEKATSYVAKASNNIEAASRAATKALGLLGIGISAVGFVSLVRGSIDAMDRLNDLSKSTGLTVEQLAGLKVAAKQSGSDLDGVAASITKMTVEMGKSPEKFKALGISATDPLEALKQFADVFNAIENPQQRAMLGAAAFGKAWASIAPLLAEGGAKIGEMVAAGTKLAGVTTDMAREADALNDKWTLLGGTGGMLTRLIAPMLPILNALADKMLKVQEQSLVTASNFNPLGEALRATIILGSNFAFVWTQMGIAMVGMQTQIEGFRTGGIKGFMAAREMVRGILDEERKAFDDFEKSIMQAGKVPKVAPVMGGMAGTQRGPIDPLEAERAARAFVEADAVIARAKKKAEEAAKAAADWAFKSGGRQFDEEMDRLEKKWEATKKVNEEAKALADDLGRAQVVADDRQKTAAQEIMQAHEDQGKATFDSLQSTADIENKAYESRLLDLNLFLLTSNNTVAEAQAAREQLLTEHEANLGDLSAQGELARQRFAALSTRNQAKQVLGELADLTAGVAQHNRGMFELNKVAGIGQAIIRAYEGISLTWNTYPYPWNIAMAAAHAASAFAQVQAIRSTTFGGGGGAPSIAGSTAATPVSPVASGSPGQNGQTTIINVQGGEMISKKQLRALTEQINENSKDGGRIIVT